MTLHLVMGGLPPAGLPGLEALLRRARASRPESCWRSSLARELGLTAPFHGAAVAGAALAEAPAGGVWFAQPVHQVAGMSRVHLHPEGLLRLDPAELHELAVAFTRELGEGRWRLCELGDGLLLVDAQAAPESVDDTDPGNWLGREIEPAQQRLPAALRRLATETEMWLHGLALNRRREQRGELPLSGLWLWGGARRVPPPRHGTAGTRPCVGSDPLLHGLAALGLCAAPSPPASFAQLAVPQTIAVLGPAQGRVQWPDFDAEWLAPLHEALARGDIGNLVLRVAGMRHELRASRWRHWWRRSASRRAGAGR